MGEIEFIGFAIAFVFGAAVGALSVRSCCMRTTTIEPETVVIDNTPNIYVTANCIQSQRYHVKNDIALCGTLRAASRVVKLERCRRCQDKEYDEATRPMSGDTGLIKLTTG